MVDGSLLGWLAVMDAAGAAAGAARSCPGTGRPARPGPTRLAPERRYLEYLRDQVRAELRRNRTLEQAVDEVPLPPGQRWLLAAENHPRNVTASFTELEWE